MRSVLLAGMIGGLLAMDGALAQGAAPAPKVDIQKAVQCQTLVVQFNDRVAASKASDDAKKAARESLAVGNKSCNEKQYDAGLAKVREALATIEVKPLL